MVQWSEAGIDNNKADWNCPTGGLWAIQWWLDVGVVILQLLIKIKELS